MDRTHFYTLMQSQGQTDYERYLNINELMLCQKPSSQLCNKDELQFQIVHQIQELWMKLIAYTLLDVDDAICAEHTPKIMTLFKRIHLTQHTMIDSLALLETMSPKDYQAIRSQLGQGSGQESPGFSLLLIMAPLLWPSYQRHYLDNHQLDVTSIYASDYQHNEAYIVGEALIEFDQLFQQFRQRHLQLIHRIIGITAQSLKGRSIDHLIAGTQHHFYPELWEIRSQMTADWSS